MEFDYFIDFVIIFTSVVVVGKKISFLFISHSWERVKPTSDLLPRITREVVPDSTRPNC